MATNEEHQDEGEPTARSRRLRVIDAGPSSSRLSQPSHPPSEPRPLTTRPGADAGADKPVRVQLIAALLLLLVLVVVPLYLWRRPRAAPTEEVPPATAITSAAVAPVDSSAPQDVKPHTKDGVTVSDARILACHDRGAKRTSPGACDRLPGLEATAAKAVLDAAGCVPPNAPAGAIAFVVDASYNRHKGPVHVSHDKNGTSMPPRVVAGCVADVKKALAGATLDATHAHGRYEIEIDAAYAARR